MKTCTKHSAVCKTVESLFLKSRSEREIKTDMNLISILASLLGIFLGISNIDEINHSLSNLISNK